MRPSRWWNRDMICISYLTSGRSNRARLHFSSNEATTSFMTMSRVDNVRLRWCRPSDIQFRFHLTCFIDNILGYGSCCSVSSRLSDWYSSSLSLALHHFLIRRHRKSIGIYLSIFEFASRWLECQAERSSSAVAVLSRFGLLIPPHQAKSHHNITNRNSNDDNNDGLDSRSFMCS